MSETPDSPAAVEAPEPPAGSVAVATLTVPSPGVGLASGPYVPPPGYFSTKWPGPAEVSGLAVPVAVLVGALGVAVVIPLSRTGIGWFLGGLVAVLATFVAVRTTRAAHPPADPGNAAYRVLWAVSSLALLSGEGPGVHLPDPDPDATAGPRGALDLLLPCLPGCGVSA